MPTQSSSSSTSRTTADRRAKVIAEVERFYRPQKPDPALQSRKVRFDALNRIVQEHGSAWITSIAGAAEIRFECLPNSTLPEELRRLGYDVREIGGGERILPNAIVERVARNADGKLVSLTVESTKPAAEVRHHAGIVQIVKFGFDVL